MSPKNENPTERRKFLRVITNARQGQLEPIEKLQLIWESGEEVAIFDISYGGVACGNSLKIPLKTGDNCSFYIQFPNGDKIQFVAEVVWTSEKLAGLNFEPMSISARKALNNFLDNKILGLSLRLIDQQFYAKNMNCQYWYQGEFGVNLYLWEQEGRIVKGEVEFDNSIVSFDKVNIMWSRQLENNAIEVEKNKIVKKAIDILGQIAVKEVQVQEFLRQVLSKAKV